MRARWSSRLPGAHVDRVDVGRFDHDHHPTVAGLIVHLEVSVVFRAELTRESIVVIGLDSRVAADLEVSVGVLEIEQQQAALEDV